jgi:Meiotic cell cortex C-terminal pleckstrin homology
LCTETANAHDQALRVDVSAQRSFSTSTLKPLGAAPADMNNASCRTPASPMPQRTLSTSILEPLNMPPAAASSSASQTTTQSVDVIPPIESQRMLDMRHLQVHEFNVEPCQRTLSVSSVEPSDLPPVESTTLTQHIATQTAPRQRMLSTSAMEPMDLPPIEIKSITLQAGTQTGSAYGTQMGTQTNVQKLEVNVPLPRQRTLSTASMEPLSAVPEDKSMVTLQSGTQTDANALGVMMMPLPRQRTLSTSSREPLSAVPTESKTVTMQNGTQTDANALGVMMVPVPRQRTLSTSSMEPLSAMPVESNNLAMQNATQTDANALGVIMMPVPRQQTLSTSIMEPLSAMPVESNAVTLQCGTQTDADTLGVMLMPIPRQRTLSTSSMEPLSAVPIESHIVTLQSGTQTDVQTLDVKIVVPRERTLSTSSMEPLNIPPTESTVVILQTAMQTDTKCSMQIGTQIDAKTDAPTRDLKVPSPRQRTLSTSNITPLSAAPAEAKNATLQTHMQTLDVASPSLRQRTLSTTTMEPLSAVPRQRKLSTSALSPLDAPPADSGSIAVQTSTQANAFDTISQRNIDNLDEVANTEYGQLRLKTAAHNNRNEPSLDPSTLHVESPEDMFGTSSQWGTTPDLSLHIAPPDSLPKRSEIDYSVDIDVDDQQSDKGQVTVNDPMKTTANKEAINTPPHVDASVQVTMDGHSSGDFTALGTPIADPHVEVDTVDTATSPISSFFPSDIHSTNYVAGPNGEDMVTRKEAEALATAYLADAMSKDKAQHATQRLAWEQKRLLKGSSMAFLNAPPRPERPPSPMLIAKTQKPPVAPKMHVTPAPKPSVSTPIPLKNKSIRSSPSISSLRPSDSVQDSAQDRTSKDEYGHVVIRKRSLVASSSSSLTSSLVESLSEHSLQRKPSLVSQSSMSLYNSPSTPSSLSVITAITKTMIGDWLWKYTRRTVGGGISEHRHRRFFWVHPYTRTLYWSAIEPGVDGSEALAKSGKWNSLQLCFDHGQTKHADPFVSYL